MVWIKNPDSPSNKLDEGALMECNAFHGLVEAGKRGALKTVGGGCGGCGYNLRHRCKGVGRSVSFGGELVTIELAPATKETVEAEKSVRKIMWNLAVINLGNS